jgi:hypothetical protein
MDKCTLVIFNKKTVVKEICGENNRFYRKISAIFANFHYEIFAKTKIFCSTLAKTVKSGEGVQHGVMIS